MRDLLIMVGADPFCRRRQCFPHNRFEVIVGLLELFPGDFQLTRIGQHQPIETAAVIQQRRIALSAHPVNDLPDRRLYRPVFCCVPVQQRFQLRIKILVSCVE